MFNLTKKAEYGLQFMVALAQNYNQGPLSLKKFAKQRELPYRFLANIALKLKKAKLVNTKEGIEGGYFLVQPPEKIEILPILEVLEGPIEMVECLRQEANCPWSAMCGQKAMFEKIKGSLKKIIQAHTLADLIKK